MKNTAGYIALHRKVRKNPLWTEPRKFSKFEAWVDLLLSASWNERVVKINGKEVLLQPGQIFLTKSQKCRDWGWGKPKCLLFFDLLEREKMISTVPPPDRSGTLVTVLNYGQLQKSKDKKVPANRTTLYLIKEQEKKKRNDTSVSKSKKTDNSAATPGSSLDHGRARSPRHIGDVLGSLGLDPKK